MKRLSRFKQNVKSLVFLEAFTMRKNHTVHGHVYPAMNRK